MRFVCKEERPWTNPCLGLWFLNGLHGINVSNKPVERGALRDVQAMRLARGSQ